MNATPSRPLRWLTRVVLPVVLLLAVLVAVLRASDDFSSLGEIPATEIALVAVLAAVGFFLNAHEFGLLYRLMGAPIGVGENWMLYSAGQLGNYAPGQIGTLYRFRYLKEVHDLAYTRATAAYGLNFAVTVFATGAIGLVGCVGLLATEGTWSPLLTLALVGLVGLAAASFFLPVAPFDGAGRLGAAWSRFTDGWSQARRRPGVATRVLLLEIVRYALLGWRLQITFGWLESDEPYWFFLVIGPIGALATFVSVVPAGLGIREVTVGAAAVALGRTFSDGLLGSAADRVIALAVVLATGIPALVLTSRRMRAAAAPS